MMHTDWGRFRWGTHVFLTMFLVSACSAFRKGDPAVLRLPLSSEPPHLDAQLADTGATIFVLNQLLSTLLGYDDERHIKARDAESYSWVSDGMELRVILRANLQWSDGAPLTACQYKEGVLRALDPKTPAALADILFDIQNAPERKAGKLEAAKVRILCDDAKRTIQFFTSKPYPSRLLHALSFVISAPIRKDIIERRGSDWLLPEGEQPGLSTGAFRVKEWSHGRRLVLEARRAREKNLPPDRVAALDRVDFLMVRDASVAFTMYENGELDVVDEIPTVQLKVARTRKDFQAYPYFTTYFVGFSLKSNPVLKNVKVRRALAYAADVEEIPEIVGGGVEAAHGWIPPGLLPEELRHRTSLYRPQYARKLLEEAGFRKIEKFPTLKLFYNSGERHQLIMERLANRWHESLGIKVELNPMDWKVLVSTLKSSPPDMFRYAWAAVYPDPLFFLTLFHSESPNNFGRWANAEFDARVSRLSTLAYEKRDAAFWKDIERAEKILIEDDPALIPIYHYVKTALVRDDVQGLRYDWRGMTDLRVVSKRGKK